LIFFGQVLLFVDDLNMPAPEQFGAQPPLELLRQFLELSGFYHTEKNAWKVHLHRRQCWTQVVTSVMLNPKMFKNIGNLLMTE